MLALGPGIHLDDSEDRVKQSPRQKSSKEDALVSQSAVWCTSTLSRPDQCADARCPVTVDFACIPAQSSLQEKESVNLVTNRAPKLGYSYQGIAERGSKPERGKVPNRSNAKSSAGHALGHASQWSGAGK